MKRQVWKKFAEQEVSHSVAHYLTTIHDLHGRQGYARLSDVARELEVTRGSVSVQIRHLKERGFVSADRNRFLQLTPLGEAVARDVRYNRKVLIEFLEKVLGVNARQAETDACKIEHLLSHEAIERILWLLQFFASGDPRAQAFREGLRELEDRMDGKREAGGGEDGAEETAGEEDGRGESEPAS